MFGGPLCGFGGAAGTLEAVLSHSAAVQTGQERRGDGTIAEYYDGDTPPPGRGTYRTGPRPCGLPRMQLLGNSVNRADAPLRPLRLIQFTSFGIVRPSDSPKAYGQPQGEARQGRQAPPLRAVEASGGARGWIRLGGRGRVRLANSLLPRRACRGNTGRQRLETRVRRRPRGDRTAVLCGGRRGRRGVLAQAGRNSGDPRQALPSRA